MRRNIFGLLAGITLNTLLLTFPIVFLGRVDWIVTDSATVLFLLFATLFYLAEVTAVLATRTERTADQRADDSTSNVVALCTSLGVLSVFWIGLTCRTAADPRLDPLQLLGAFFFVLGIVLRRTAIRDLGPFFVTAIVVRKEQPLARSGIYRIVRHPSETGLLAIVFGASLLLASIFGSIVCCLIILPMSVWRMRREDRCLEQAFGEQFRDYTRQVKSILPFVL